MRTGAHEVSRYSATRGVCRILATKQPSEQGGASEEHQAEEGGSVLRRLHDRAMKGPSLDPFARGEHDVADAAPVFFFRAEDGIRAGRVTGVQTCALPIWNSRRTS